MRVTSIIVDTILTFCCCFYVESKGSAAQQELATRLVCAAGLADMEFKRYKNAARLLTKASIEHCKCQDVSLFNMLLVYILFLYLNVPSPTPYVKPHYPVILLNSSVIPMKA